MKQFTLAQQAARFGVTIDAIRAQHMKNAADCDKTASKAETTGKKPGGYTASQWRTMARNHRAIAAGDANVLAVTEAL